MTATVPNATPAATIATRLYVMPSSPIAESLLRFTHAKKPS
jgi:hypothetical protein